MSTTAATDHDHPTSEFDRSSLDLGQLVGRKVSLFSKQHPGTPIKARVVQATGGKLALERVLGSSALDSLVSNQEIVMRFIYKKEEVATPAVFKRADGGRTMVIVGETAKPLRRRRFVRVNSRQPINLAVLPTGSFQKRNLPHLRWIQTDLVDFASGGVLFEINSFLPDSTYLLVNLAFESHEFPPLIIGGIRHCQPLEAGQFRVGLEFIVAEQRHKHFPKPLLDKLPPSAFDYSYLHRKSLNGHISAWTQKNITVRDQRYFK